MWHFDIRLHTLNERIVLFRINICCIMLLKLLANTKNGNGAAGAITENLRSGSVGDKQIRLWHFALLVGIPSATIFAYIFYKRRQSASSKKADDGSSSSSSQAQKQQQQKQPSKSNDAASSTRKTTGDTVDSPQSSPAAKKQVRFMSLIAITYIFRHYEKNNVIKYIVAA